MLRLARVAAGEIREICVCGEGSQLGWDGEVNPGKWAGGCVWLICIISLFYRPWCLAVTFWPLAMVKISKYAFALHKSILKLCVWVCACVLVCAQYMWQTVCRSVGWGESSTSLEERWASVSHGPWALFGLSSCLVIGYLPDMSLRLDRTRTQTHTQADEELERMKGREATKRAGKIW